MVLKYLRGRHTPGMHFLGRGTGATPSLPSCRRNDAPPAPGDVKFFCGADTGADASSSAPGERPFSSGLISTLNRKGSIAQMIRRATSAIRTNLPSDNITNGRPYAVVLHSPYFPFFLLRCRLRRPRMRRPRLCAARGCCVAALQAGRWPLPSLL